MPPPGSDTPPRNWASDEFDPPRLLPPQVDFSDEELLWKFLTAAGAGAPTFRCLPDHPALTALFKWEDGPGWVLSGRGVAWIATYILQRCPIRQVDLEFLRGLPRSTRVLPRSGNLESWLRPCVGHKLETDEYHLSEVGKHLLGMVAPKNPGVRVLL